MDRPSIGPVPPASARASTPPAAARSAWPAACIKDPATMANPRDGRSRTARPARAYRDRDLTQMSVHPLPPQRHARAIPSAAAASRSVDPRTQIAKFFRRTSPAGTRYDGRSSRSTRSEQSQQSGQPRQAHFAVSFARHDLTSKPRLVKRTGSSPTRPIRLASPSSRLEPSRTCPAGSHRKPTRVRLP